MGSGRSGLYSGTRGSSQPYASSYQVVKSMHERDKANESVWTNKNGYEKNPTAIDIADAIHDSSIIHEGHKANGKMTYVVDSEGRLIFGKRADGGNPRARSPHPTLIGGKNPKVKVAGMIEFRNGKIYAIDNNSGHYRPPEKSLEAAEKALAKLPRKIFHRFSKWRRK